MTLRYVLVDDPRQAEPEAEGDLPLLGVEPIKLHRATLRRGGHRRAARAHPRPRMGDVHREAGRGARLRARARNELRLGGRGFDACAARRERRQRLAADARERRP